MAGKAAAVVVFALQLQAGFQRCSRGLALQVDQAGQGVGTVAGALRPQQYFHLFDVIQHGGGADTGKIDAVDQHAHRRIQRLGKLAGFANAAQLHIACARAAAGHVDVGCIQQNVFQMQCILLLHQCSIEHADAGGDTVEWIAAEVGSDDDFFDGY